MKSRIVGLSILLAAASLACVPAGADNITVINTNGATPFVYEGYTYMPVQSVTKFLGADLGWDPNTSQAVVTYQGQKFALTPGKTNATFDGRQVYLTSPPVVINGRTYVSTETFKKYYNVPMKWSPTTSTVSVFGPNGWGTTTVRNQAPWHGGPPPWAPAWGQRGKHIGYWVDSDKQKQSKGPWKLKSKSQTKWIHATPTEGKKYEKGKVNSKHNAYGKSKGSNGKGNGKGHGKKN